METKIQNTNVRIVPEDIVKILRTIYDPEIEFSIYDLGLIYEVNIDEKEINIVMTLTSMNCPEAQSLPESVRSEIQLNFPDLFVNIEITFDPLWSVDNMSDEVKLKIGLL